MKYRVRLFAEKTYVLTENFEVEADSEREAAERVLHLGRKNKAKLNWPSEADSYYFDIDDIAEVTR